MKIIKIQSGKPIDADTKKKICDIFAESQCPNESLVNSIPEFTNYDGNGTIQLTEGEDFVDYISVNSATDSK